MEIVILFIVAFSFFVYGVVLGWKARERHALKVTNELVGEVQKGIEEAKKSLIHITIEQHDGVIYVYNKKDKTFMAQGKSKEEVEEVLTSRFPGKKFAASEEELQKVGFIS